MKNLLYFLTALLCISRSFSMDIQVDLLDDSVSFYAFGGTTVVDDTAYFIGEKISATTLWKYDGSKGVLENVGVDATDMREFLFVDNLVYFIDGSDFGVFDMGSKQTDVISADGGHHSLVQYSDTVLCMCGYTAKKRNGLKNFLCYDLNSNTFTDYSDGSYFCTDSPSYNMFSVGGKVYGTFTNANTGVEFFSFTTADGFNLISNFVAGSGSSYPSYGHVFQDNIFFTVLNSGSSTYNLVKFNPSDNSVKIYQTQLSQAVYRYGVFQDRLYIGMAPTINDYYLGSLSLDSNDLEIVTKMRAYGMIDFDGNFLVIGYPDGTFDSTVFKVDIETNTTEVVNIINDQWIEPNVNGDLFMKAGNHFVIQGYDIDLAPDLGPLFGWKGKEQPGSGSKDGGNKSKGLSDGAIAGIVIGSTAGCCCLLILLILLILRIRKGKNKVQHQ